MIHYDCIITLNGFTGLILSFPDYYKAVQYKEARIAALVPGTNTVIHIVGKLRLSSDYRSQIEATLDEMVIEVLKTFSAKNSN